MQSQYNRTAKTWHTCYDPIECARLNACQYCSVLDQELDRKKGNVFYDVKSTRIVKGDWLFPDQEVSNIRKGVKVLDRTASLTLCDAIVRYGRHSVIETFMINHHHARFFDPTLRYELVNFRVQRQNTRDIMQDLADAAAGIEVVHQADEDKLAREQKRARKQVRQAQRIRSLEKLVLTQDMDSLDNTQRYRINKYLGEERVQELLKQRENAAELVQTGLFDTLPAA